MSMVAFQLAGEKGRKLANISNGHCILATFCEDEVKYSRRRNRPIENNGRL